MVDVITSIRISSPIATVTKYCSNPENAPTWYVNIKSAFWRPTPPLRVGSLIDFVAHFLGRKPSHTYEVTEISQHRFVMQTAQGPFPMRTTYEWRDLDGGETEMTLRNNGHPTGFSKLLAPFMSMMLRRANNADRRRLKHILESR